MASLALQQKQSTNLQLRDFILYFWHILQFNISVDHVIYLIHTVAMACK